MRTVLLATLITGLSACAGKEADTGHDSDDHTHDTDTHEHETDEPGTGNFTNVAASDAGSFHVRYTPTPSPIPLNDYFEVRVEAFTDAEMTAPAVGMPVTFDAYMPAHGHGMNVEPAITDNGDGTWDVSGLLFHMEGDWQVTVGLEGAGGLESALFDVACCG